MADTRFPTALQIVVIVASNEATGTRTTSSLLAEGLNTNPSFVRKLVSTLTRAGILKSSDGASGGVQMAKKPGDVSLLEINRAILPQQRPWTPRKNLPSSCTVTRNIGELSNALGDQADSAVSDFLKGVSVKDCMLQIAELERASSETVS